MCWGDTSHPPPTPSHHHHHTLRRRGDRAPPRTTKTEGREGGAYLAKVLLLTLVSSMCMQAGACVVLML